MRILILATTVSLLSTAFAGAGADPFAADSNSPAFELKSAIVAAKPLTLEICYGETTANNPDFVINDAFLAQATCIQIPVATTDEGRVTRTVKRETSDIVYRLRPAKQNSELELIFTLKNTDPTTGAQSLRELSPRLTIFHDGDWLRLGGLTREEVVRQADGTETTVRLNFVVGLRLTTTSPP